MLNVLLVEDEISVGNLINKGLSERGYKISIAPDGDIGYEMAVKNEFDIMILDIMLPGVTGYQICRRMRKDPELYKHAILVLTALGEEPVVLGVDGGMAMM